jgi:F-type H+-transporting ATPase subunit delta
MARTEVLRWAEALVDAAADRPDEAVSALWEIAEALGSSIQSLSGVVEAERLNAALGRALEIVGRQEPVAAVKATSGATMPGECARRVAVLLARNGKLSSIGAIVVAARGILDERAGLVRVRAESVEPLSEELREGLRAALERKIAADFHVAPTIELEERIDPALLGGLRVGIGWERIDGTLRRRLEVLSSALGAEKRGGDTW